MTPAQRLDVDRAVIDLLNARSVLDLIRDKGAAPLDNALVLMIRIIEAAALRIDHIIEDEFGPAPASEN